jgi:homoserine kinase
MMHHRFNLNSIGCGKPTIITTKPCNINRFTPKAAQANANIDPVEEEVAAFAPATVANLGPGFDWLGCAVDGDGDVVVARALLNQPPGTLIIESIEGDNGRLSLIPSDNCVGIAAAETLRLMGAIPSCGIGLSLKKGLPLGSGMGSSAASAAAGAVAVNALFGNKLTKTQLIPAGLASEAAVSGYHADNIAPAILGDFVLIRTCQPDLPLDILQLPFGSEPSSSSLSELWFVLVNPLFEAPTAQMRAALPKQVAMSSAVKNCAAGGALVAGITFGNVALLGAALDSDVIVEPVRGKLIPGFSVVKEAAKAAGAYGCTISGAGPTAVAVVSDPEVGERVKEAMVEAFKSKGGLQVNSAKVVKLDSVGARAF